MRRFLFALVALLTVTATPTFAGYLIIRVLLDSGNGSGNGNGGTGNGNPLMTPPKAGSGTKWIPGPNVGGSSGGPPPTSKGGPPPMSDITMPKGPMTSPYTPGGNTTRETANLADFDHGRSVVVVIPLETLLKEEKLDRTKGDNKENNPKFQKFVVPYYGRKLQSVMFVDSSSIQIYNQLLEKPPPKHTRRTEMLDKHAEWVRSKNPEVLYDAMVLALRSGFIREVPIVDEKEKKNPEPPNDALTYAEELLAVAKEGKPLPPNVERFVKAWGAVSKAVRGPARDSTDGEMWKNHLIGAKDVQTEGHYALVYFEEPTQVLPGQFTEVGRRLRQLNDNFIAFYLFHATRGVAPPVPTKPLVAVLARDGREHIHVLNRALDGLPTASDAFYAPEHDLLVLSPERIDNVGHTFMDQCQQEMMGLSRDPLLSGLIPKLDHTGEKGSKPQDVARAVMYATVEKLVIEEAELAAVSREGTRQLLFATNQLPKHVTLPNWLTNGSVSSFTRPRGPAYVTIGEKEKPFMHVAMTTGYDVPNYVLQRYFKDISEGLKKEKDAPASYARMLENVLSDAYFAGIKDADDPDPAPPSKKKTPVVPPKTGTVPGTSPDIGAPPPRPMVGGAPPAAPGPGPMGGGSLGGPPPMPMGGPPPMPGPMGGGSLGGPPPMPGTNPGTQPGADVEDPVVAQRKKRERLTIKAHATAWALYFYLAREKPELLEKYIGELNKLPRDLPIDGRTAYKSFVRVFGLSAPDGTADPVKLKKFAQDWTSYMESVSPAGFDIELVAPETATDGGTTGPKLPMGSGSGPPPMPGNPNN